MTKLHPSAYSKLFTNMWKKARLEKSDKNCLNYCDKFLEKDYLLPKSQKHQIEKQIKKKLKQSTMQIKEDTFAIIAITLTSGAMSATRFRLILLPKTFWVAFGLPLSDEVWNEMFISECNGCNKKSGRIIFPNSLMK